MTAKIVKTRSVICPINGTTTIKFETDAEDNYFNEHTGIGKIEYSHDIIAYQTLRTGIFTLKINPKMLFTELKIGQEFILKLEIHEKSNIRFTFEIPIQIGEPCLKINSPKPTKTKKRTPYTRIVKSSNTPNDDGQWTPPQIRPVSKIDDPKKWNKLFDNERKGIHVQIDSNDNMVIFVNVSHPSLIKYQEKHPDMTKKRLIEKYSNYVALTSYAAYCIQKGKIIKYSNDIDIKDMMENTSDAVALFGLLYKDAE